jgi:hypothetical protein
MPCVNGGQACDLEAHHRDAWRKNLGGLDRGTGLDVFLLGANRSEATGEASMSRRILVVEDQEDNRTMRDLLTANDYEMTEAENGGEALAAVAKERPDLILMEI